MKISFIELGAEASLKVKTSDSRHLADVNVVDAGVVVQNSNELFQRSLVLLP